MLVVLGSSARIDHCTQLLNVAFDHYTQFDHYMQLFDVAFDKPTKRFLKRDLDSDQQAKLLLFLHPQDAGWCTEGCRRHTEAACILSPR